MQFPVCGLRFDAVLFEGLGVPTFKVGVGLFLDNWNSFGQMLFLVCQLNQLQEQELNSTA